MTLELVWICLFTFLIHLSETLAYCMRLSGIRSRNIAIALSFVTSTLLISRLSNMMQAPLLGVMVDNSVSATAPHALGSLEYAFRLIIFSGSLGTLIGMLMTPTAVYLFQKAIQQFLEKGSLPLVFFSALKPSNTVKIFKSFRPPRLPNISTLSYRTLPKGFLFLNMGVTSIYTIGVLCSLLAGAYLPHFRSTANQLSGIVNGLATIMLTLFVDPSGARITDQAYHHARPENDVRSTVFFLQMGKLVGTAVIAQVLLKPFTLYIMWVTQFLH